jgi:hypothetical protein
MRGRHIPLAAVGVAAVGWWALLQLTARVGPDQPGALFLFFAILLPTLTATITPIAAYLNRRFAPKASTRAPLRYLRHSIMAGLCLTFWAWLQIYRAFNLGFAFIITLIFVTIEILVVRIRSES